MRLRHRGVGGQNPLFAPNGGVAADLLLLSKHHTRRASSTLRAEHDDYCPLEDMFDIVQVTPGGGGVADAATKRLVRSHAMRHYRQRQRAARSRGIVAKVSS